MVNRVDLSWKHFADRLKTHSGLSSNIFDGSGVFSCAIIEALDEFKGYASRLRSCLKILSFETFPVFSPQTWSTDLPMLSFLCMQRKLDTNKLEVLSTSGHRIGSAVFPARQVAES